MRPAWLAVAVPAVLLVVAAGCHEAAPGHAVLTVEGMHCDGCSAAITTELERLDGVVSASADWQAGSAEATFDTSKITETDLRATVEGLGYKVTSIAVDGAVVPD